MKRKMIRESVYKIKARRKFFIQTIEGWKDFVQTIIDIHYGIFKIWALLRDEITSGYAIRSGLLGMVFIQERV